MAGRCLALATLVALAGLGAQGVHLRASQGHQALAELGVHASSVSQADLRDRSDFTPEQRKLLHEQAFEKEFTVMLDMKEARERDLYLGMELDCDTDFTPISVTKIRKSGLVEVWNKNNPSRAILVGDTITKVNDVLWHHNSKVFTERIKGQWRAYKGGKAGTKDVFELFVQRPRKSENEGRTQVQRDDLYRQKYPRDFALDIPFVPNMSMGWVLNSTTIEWTPPSIDSISSAGMLALYNNENPDFRLYPGDEIVTCNGIHWHHNTQTFKSRIETMLHRSIAEANSTIVMSLHIQRPNWVVEELESKKIDKMFDVTFPALGGYPRSNGATDIGWSLKMNTTDPISITDIASGSWLSSWNEANPTQSLAVGDRILKATHAKMTINWHHDKVNFGSRLLNLLSTRHGVNLRVQRKFEFKYSKGWNVEIPARVNQLLGLRMNASDDELPLTISMIKPLTAVSIFNEDDPDNALMPGDQIFKVNDIMWRSNSRRFAQQLEQQFAKSRRTGVMRLWVQRPEGLETDDGLAHVDWAGHRYMDYTVELNVSSPQAMGWQLDHNKTGEGPVFVSGITLGTKTAPADTRISNWNKKNPLKEIQVGDQIMQVDNNAWHNNTDIFLKHFNHQLADAASSNVKGSVLVLMRRPFATTPMVEGDVDMAPASQAAEDDGDDVMGAEE
jgi:hypothetical protein